VFISQPRLQDHIEYVDLTATVERGTRDFLSTVQNGDRALLRAFDYPSPHALYSFIAFGEWSIGWDASTAQSRRDIPADAQMLADLANGDTLLHIAARNGSGEVLRLLLEAGADAAMPNARGETAVQVACDGQAAGLLAENGQTGAVRMLSQLGEEIEEIVRTIAGANHRQEASSEGLMTCYEILVQQVDRYRDVMRQARVAGRLGDRHLGLCMQQLTNWSSLMDVLMSSSRQMLALTEPIPDEESEEEEALPMPDLATVSPRVLARYLVGLFELADTDGNGTLDLFEIESLLEASGLHFSPEMVKHILVEADTDGDGQVDYEEFVPMMVSVIGYHNQLAHPESQVGLAMPDLRTVSSKVLPVFCRGSPPPLDTDTGSPHLTLTPVAVREFVSFSSITLTFSPSHTL